MKAAQLLSQQSVISHLCVPLPMQGGDWAACELPVEMAHHSLCSCFVALGNMAPVLRGGTCWLYWGQCSLYIILMSCTFSDGNMHLVLGISNSELGRIWIVDKCSSVFRPAQFLAHFLFLVLADERFSSHIKSGAVSAGGCVALGSSPEAGF